MGFVNEGRNIQVMSLPLTAIYIIKRYGRANIYRTSTKTVLGWFGKVLSKGIRMMRENSEICNLDKCLI
jgi:hypothetical protein